MKVNNQDVSQILDQNIKNLRESGKNSNANSVQSQAPQSQEVLANRPEFFRNVGKYGPQESAHSENLVSGPDRINVSAGAKAMAKALDPALDTVDIEKVNKIKTALQNGTYKVDYDKVAESLLRDDILNTVL